MDKILSALLRGVGLLLPFIRTGDKKRRIAGIVLVISNIIPLIGIFFFDWQPYYVILLFWAESAIIGFFNILRMLSSGFLTTKGFRPVGIIMGLFLSAFFTLHYGGFMLGHLIFIVALLIPQSGLPSDSLFSAPLQIFNDPLTAQSMAAAFAFLFISHGYTFYAIFIKEKWYLDHEPQDFMARPYVRIVIMHLTIIFGAMLMIITGLKPVMVVLLVLMKTVADLYSLRRENRPIAKRRASASEKPSMQKKIIWRK